MVIENLINDINTIKPKYGYLNKIARLRNNVKLHLPEISKLEESLFGDHHDFNDHSNWMHKPEITVNKQLTTLMRNLNKHAIHNDSQVCNHTDHDNHSDFPNHR